MNRTLWYREPASSWFDALPIGTGRLAGMVLGTVKTERLALNHEWLWKGVARDRDNVSHADRLPEVRRLLLDGHYAQGTAAGNEAFVGPDGGRILPWRMDPYQPAGDLHVAFNHGAFHDYRRSLDLDTAEATVRYQAGGKPFLRQYLAHLTDDVLLARFTHDGAPFDCSLWLDRVFDPDCAMTSRVEDSTLVLTGAIDHGIAFRVEATVWHREGEQRADARGRLHLLGTREAIVAINIGTSSTGNDPAEECGKRAPSTWQWDELNRSNQTEYDRHYGALRLDLSLEDPDRPTDARIDGLRSREADAGLALLFFNYGRYLFCASSATASLPANLQGKWCEDLEPEWNSDYHHDINLQMNYWMAESAGMQKYTEALFQHIERFVPHGRQAARDIYGCNGIWLPLASDAWGRCTAEAQGWGAWIGAAPWLAQHLWWHYEFSLDIAFLSDRAYPFFKEVAAFYESYLIRDDQGAYQIVPSQSPENRFVGGGDAPVTLCVSSSLDVQLCRDLLSHAIKAAEILDKDPEDRGRWQHILAHLPPLKVGSRGQLLEWNEEFDEAEPGHRHLSHLFGLFPGDQIHPERTPELFAAALQSLRLRLTNSGGHTGWSRAWTACCFARAGLGDEALDHVEHLVTEFATRSLLDLHPPRIFQIDGNLGAAAAVIEMLLQSYHEELCLLPALPTKWPSGSITGLRGRGGYRVDIVWRNHALETATIAASRDRTCVLIDPERTYLVTTSTNETVTVAWKDGKTRFPMAAGQTVIVRTTP